MNPVCPNWRDHGVNERPCPYGPTQCRLACVDSWDGDGCHTRQPDGTWAWKERDQ